MTAAEYQGTVTGRRPHVLRHIHAGGLPAGTVVYSRHHDVLLDLLCNHNRRMEVLGVGYVGHKSRYGHGSCGPRPRNTIIRPREQSVRAQANSWGLGQPLTVG